MSELAQGAAFDCPVSWCEGLRGEHGAYGELPDTWLHTSSVTRLEGLGYAMLSREGAGQVGYFVHLEHDGAPHNAAELAKLARDLRHVADHLEERAEALAAL